MVTLPATDTLAKLMITGVYQEHRFRPGVMEFQVQSIVLLDEVRKLMTRKLHLLMPLGSLTDETVAFLTNNLRTHPGNTDVFIQIFDEEDGMQTKLKSAGLRLEINDELVNFLNDNGNIRYSLEIVNN